MYAHQADADLNNGHELCVGGTVLRKLNRNATVLKKRSAKLES